MHIKHILVKHHYEIEDIERKLKEGADFEDLARRFSICSSSKQGGDLGVIREGQTVEDFESVAFSLSVGEISKPLRTSFGYHLILRSK